MKKSFLFFIPFLFVLAIIVEHAYAVPNNLGEYTGTSTIVVTSCSDSEMNGIYNAVLAINIDTQTGNTFGGSATGTFKVDGLTATEYIQLSGTITESGQISGETTHTFLGTGGEGTFTGQLSASGLTLTLVNSGHDTYGDICSYTRNMTAFRKPSVLKIVSSDLALNDGFGDSVSISGDFAIVGAPNSASGSAYIFEKSGSSWNQVAKLIANDAEGGDWFGESVSISGGYAIVGSKDKWTGSAYIFEKSGSTWNQVAKLIPSDAAFGDYFGHSVSISGGYAIVGSFKDDCDESVTWECRGSAYIFERSGSSWNQVAKLTASDAEFGDLFGWSVSISGEYAIVGVSPSFAEENEERSAYIFQRGSGSWNQVAKLTGGDHFGTSVSISGSYAIVGDPDGTGSAYIYERSGSSWNQVAKLNPIDPDSFDSFGWSVSISGGYAIVGASENGMFNSGNSYGAAYIFGLPIPGDPTIKTRGTSMPWIPLLLLDE